MDILAFIIAIIALIISILNSIFVRKIITGMNTIVGPKLDQLEKLLVDWRKKLNKIL